MDVEAGEEAAASVSWVAFEVVKVVEALEGWVAGK